MFVDVEKLSGAGYKIPPSPVPDSAPLKLGDGVVFYDANDNPVKGTARWIGVNKVALPSGAMIVGIEMVSFNL